jgi:hypothetical protein
MFLELLAKTIERFEHGSACVLTCGHARNKRVAGHPTRRRASCHVPESGLRLATV